jgi:hypothetical protein
LIAACPLGDQSRAKKEQGMKPRSSHVLAFGSIIFGFVSSGGDIRA